MLFGTLAATLFQNIFADKGAVRAGECIITAARIFNAAFSFNKVWNKKTLSKWRAAKLTERT